MKEDVEKIVNDLIELNMGERVGLYHVSDYVFHCPRKTVYDHLVLDNIERNSNSSLFFGTAFHELMEKHLKVYKPKWLTEQTILYDVLNDKIATNVSEENATQIIAGTFDAVYEINGKKILIDYKTSFCKGKIPSPSYRYKLQMNIYNIMCKSAGIKIDKAFLVYFDKSKNKDFGHNIYAVEVQLRPEKEIKDYLLKRYMKYLATSKTNELPNRHISDFWCNICPYSDRCFGEERIENMKFQSVVPYTERYI